MQQSPLINRARPSAVNGRESLFRESLGKQNRQRSGRNGAELAMRQSLDSKQRTYEGIFNRKTQVSGLKDSGVLQQMMHANSKISIVRQTPRKEVPKESYRDSYRDPERLSMRKDASRQSVAYSDKKGSQIKEPNSGYIQELYKKYLAKDQPALSPYPPNSPPVSCGEGLLPLLLASDPSNSILRALNLAKL